MNKVFEQDKRSPALVFLYAQIELACIDPFVQPITREPDDRRKLRDCDSLAGVKSFPEKSGTGDFREVLRRERTRVILQFDLLAPPAGKASGP